MKKKRQLIMTEAQHRGLKALAAKSGCFQGEMIGILINFVELGNMVTDADFKSRFNNLFEQAILDADEDQGGFGAGHKDITLKENGKADMKSQQEKIRKHE